MRHSTQSAPGQFLLPFYATPREACQKLSQSRQEAQDEAAAPPVVREPAPEPAPRRRLTLENLARANSRKITIHLIRDESDRQSAAVQRSDFFCNRLIENRFPPVNFSDMTLIPCHKSSMFTDHPQEDYE